MIYQGSCHCQGVRFEVEAGERFEAERCNCSICTKAGFIHLIVPLSKFRLLAGSELLCSYRFNSGVAEHRFCRVCGIKPFYTPRSNPDGIDINVNCLDTQPIAVDIVDFDGQNWEENAHTLAAKSKEN